MPIYNLNTIKTFRSVRKWDAEGKPFKILDDDLEDLLTDSDFSRPRRRGAP
jgi:hypothetical protein